MDKPSDIFPLIRSVLQRYPTFKVKELCDMACVSRSGYYAWCNGETLRNAKEEQDRKDFLLILEAYKFRGYHKGAKSIYMYLLHRPELVIMNLKKIRRLMKKYRLYCPIRKLNPYKQLLRQLKTEHKAPNLLQREFEKYGPRMVLLTDITYLPYKNGTFAYLSTILDAFTKQILAYTVSQTLEEDFVLKTVQQLIEKHGISLHKETLIHSDQGAHYTCIKFIELLKNVKIRQSMSRRGNCWDNSPQESFFGHMKDSIGARVKQSQTFEEVKMLVDDYIDYYNTERYQWKLAKLSPDEYYKFFMTGNYPIDVPQKADRPVAEKPPVKLGFWDKFKSVRD